MAKEFSRTQRIGDQMQRELAQLIQFSMKDPRLGMVTVSGVNVTKDLAFADVHVSFLGVDDDEKIQQSMQILTQAAGFLRSELARAIKLRFTPRLRFHYDNTLRHGAYMSALIEEARSKDSDFNSDETEQSEDKA